MRVIVSLAVLAAEDDSLGTVNSGRRRIRAPSRKRSNAGRSNDAGSRLIPYSSATSPYISISNLPKQEEWMNMIALVVLGDGLIYQSGCARQSILEIVWREQLQS